MTELSIDVETIAELDSSEYALIDIRGAESWINGTPRHARTMLSSDVLIHADQLKSDYKQLFVICFKGHSSAELVQQLGSPFYSVSGGYQAWVEAGLAVDVAEPTSSLSRYDRQMRLSGFGKAGQERLKQARVLIIGMGGLGATVATYLAAAGVGELTLVDADVVALHNLHRQVLYREQDVNQPKVEAARSQLMALNSEVKVNAVHADFSKINADSLVAAVDLVVDGTDSMEARLLINDTCLKIGKPWVFAAVSGFYVQVSVFSGQRNDACYRSVFGDSVQPEIGGGCNEEGILGPIPGIAAMIQATEVIKILSEQGVPLMHKMLSYDLLHQQFKVLKYSANAKSCSLP